MKACGTNALFLGKIFLGDAGAMGFNVQPDEDGSLAVDSEQKYGQVPAVAHITPSPAISVPNDGGRTVADRQTYLDSLKGGGGSKHEYSSFEDRSLTWVSSFGFLSSLLSIGGSHIILSSSFSDPLSCSTGNGQESDLLFVLRVVCT